MSNEQQSQPRVSGTIKFFLPEKGYGFIVPSDGGKDLFFHSKALANGVVPMTNQKVSFVREEHDKGPRALQVRVE